MQLRALTVSILLLAGTAPSAAHHGPEGLDRSRTVTLRGTVVDTVWVNPHALVTIDVRSNGTTQRWTVQLSPPGAMRRKELSRDVFKAGTVMSATGYLVTGASRTLDAVEFTLPDGRTFQTGNGSFTRVPPGAR